MSCPKTGIIHYHQQLGIPDNDQAIQELIVWWVLPNTPSVWTEKERLAILSYTWLLALTAALRPYEVCIHF